MTQYKVEQRLEMALEDRLTQKEGWVYMTGMQALVRLPIQQHQNDKAAGLNTGGFISGYRGSPMGRYDIELWAASDVLKVNQISFRAGVNEELAATAMWGSQYVEDQKQATVDGVFAIWYGKGPGVDRAMDPLRHAALAGTSGHGGALVLAGDDHGAKSSTVVNYSDLNFASAGIPLLYPSNAQEVLDFGLHGIAMSRYSGCVIGMKLVTDVVEGGRSVYLTPNSIDIKIPEETSVNRLPWVPLLQEKTHYDVRIPAAIRYARLNKLDKLMSGSADAKIGIISAGKAYQDVEQGLRDLTCPDGKLGSLEVSVLKLGLIWPIDRERIAEFTKGLDTLIIAEEKRPLIEEQVRSTLYGFDHQPEIIGKTYQDGTIAFPNHGEITPELVSEVIATAANNIDKNCGLTLQKTKSIVATLSNATARAPTFCSGCPHGRSTQVIEGSRALAGIGCHSIAMFKDRERTSPTSQMGGEGAMWLGQTDFTDEDHVFTNMGDGTYFHSGILAVRAAVAANVNITYKLLHNGFVSMTGGQPIDGELSATQMIGQFTAEGVKKICLVTDDPEKFKAYQFPSNTTLHERVDLVPVQQELRAFKGVSVMLYDQPCATERRRLRKRGKWVDPDMRVFINEAVCEGCGDCSTISGCMAIEPLETELGRKRTINQSSCNKDFSCVEGFCPSFVSVSGAMLKGNNGDQQQAETFDMSGVPAPDFPIINGSYGILVSGIGGTGVVTIGQTLAVGAHLEGLYSSNLDVTGLAQKYGAVHSHVKVANDPDALHATRIAMQEAESMIGCDIVVASGDEALSKLHLSNAKAVVDKTLVPTGDFSANPDWSLNVDQLTDRLDTVLKDNVAYFNTQKIAETLLGGAIFSNMMLLGAAWQQGAIPLSEDALKRAIKLNNVAVDSNVKAFDLGRLLIHDYSEVEKLMGGAQSETVQHFTPAKEKTLEETISHRMGLLTEYQNDALAKRYQLKIKAVIDASAHIEGGEALAMAAAKYYYKLLANKDGWEVARLYSRPEFLESLKDTFDGDLKVSFHVGSWPFAIKNKRTGQLMKRQVGPWMLNVFKVMARFKGLRGTLLDPFKNNEEGVLSRRLLEQYETDMALVTEKVSQDNFAEAVQLLSLPERIRGYGHARIRHVEELVEVREGLLEVLAA